MSGSRREPGRRRRLRSAGVLLAALVAGAGLPAVGTAAPGCAADDRECQVDGYLQQVRSDPALLGEFATALPKGGDLHNHLHGAVPPETLIRYAAEDGRCIDTATLAAAPGPCRPGQRPAADAQRDPGFRRQVIRAWSMAEFDPAGTESGHDHFFATFGKFAAAADGRDGGMLAEVSRDAARQHESYVETMFSRRSAEVRDLVSRRGFDPHDEREFAALRRALLPEMAGIVQAAKRDDDRDFARRRALLGCAGPAPEPACAVRVAADFQVGREAPPARVFASLLLGFELARHDERVVGVNMVQPEDGPISLRDYSLHMRMVGFLRSLYPGVHVTLHAGELVPGLVKPADLAFHIREAVDVAEADRIGHGVDLEHEDGWRALAVRMRTRDVLVEAPLTSNCQILGACGPQEHPLPEYLRHGVPVALATDDPGVSRSDLSAEYRRAVERFGLGYRALKASARNSLEHAFLPGRSLWEDAPGGERVRVCTGGTPGRRDPEPQCADFLRDNPKAAVQWDHEAALLHFEEDYAHCAAARSSSTVD